MDEEWVSYSGIFARRGDGLQQISISFSKPRRTSSGDFACKLVVDGLHKAIEESVVGLDGVQALCLALNVAKSIVESTDEFRNGLIVYEDGTPFDGLVSASA